MNGGGRDGTCLFVLFVCMCCRSTLHMAFMTICVWGERLEEGGTHTHTWECNTCMCSICHDFARRSVGERMPVHEVSPCISFVC
jgi:hypothetical protein